MNHRKLTYWSWVVALAGFLFGFDTIVISGAEQALQELWNTSNFFHSTFVVSMALWGTVIGSLFGGFPTNKLGRKNTLFLIGLLYFISALGSSLAWDPYSFSFFRFLGGLGVGASTIAAPIYVAEIAPPKRRGRMVALYQFNIVFGILIAFLSNYLLRDTGFQPWRWMLGIEAIPALVYTIMIMGVPKSPKWLYMVKGDKTAAEKVLRIIDPSVDTAKEFQRMQASAQERIPGQGILHKKYRTLIGLAFFIALFNQLSGINAFLYYSKRIFEMAGLEASSAFLSGIGVGIVNLSFTILGVYLIDRLGRKKLMYFGSFGYIISLVLVTCAFVFKWEGLLVSFFLFAFIASHAIGQGAVIWVFISEIFPSYLRAYGTAIGTTTHWILAALITVFMGPFLTLFENPAPVFGFFALMMMFQLIWVATKMPETKGISLEELSKKLLK